MWEDPMNGGTEAKFKSAFENTLALIWFWRAWIRKYTLKALLQEQVFGLFYVSYNYTVAPNKRWVKPEDVILHSFLTQNSPSCSVGAWGGVLCYATLLQFLILVHSERYIHCATSLFLLNQINQNQKEKPSKQIIIPFGKNNLASSRCVWYFDFKRLAHLVKVKSYWALSKG